MAVGTEREDSPDPPVGPSSSPSSGSVGRGVGESGMGKGGTAVAGTGAVGVGVPMEGIGGVGVGGAGVDVGVPVGGAMGVAVAVGVGEGADLGIAVMVRLGLQGSSAQGGKRKQEREDPARRPSEAPERPSPSVWMIRCLGGSSARRRCALGLQI
jgi:hypothetical protein